MKTACDTSGRAGTSLAGPKQTDEFLELFSRGIINEVAGIPRVTYDVPRQRLAAIEWE